MMRALFLIAALLIAPVGAIAAGLPPSPRTTISATSPPAPLTDTLFYSVQERAKLDKARRSGNVQEPDSPAQVALVINGVVSRDDGSTSVWVDGKMVGPLDAVIASKVNGSAVGHPDGLKINTNETLAIRTPAKSGSKTIPRRLPAAKRQRQ